MERIWSDAVESSWRVYPAAALALLGLVLMVRGLWIGADGKPGLLRQGRDAFAWIRCFQIAVGGLCLVGLAAAWVWQEPWLMVAALAILGEEMHETSRILTAIEQSPRRSVVPGASRGATT